LLYPYTPVAADWILNISDLKLDVQVGTGSSCDVYKGYLKGNNEVAIKKMKIKSLSENHLKEFRREITALVNIRPHKNLVSLIGIS
jgi:serine/threonine protein kinase